MSEHLPNDVSASANNRHRLRRTRIDTAIYRLAYDLVVGPTPRVCHLCGNVEDTKRLGLRFFYQIQGDYTFVCTQCMGSTARNRRCPEQDCPGSEILEVWPDRHCQICQMQFEPDESAKYGEGHGLYWVCPECIAEIRNEFTDCPDVEEMIRAIAWAAHDTDPVH